MTEVKSLYDIGFEHGYAKGKADAQQWIPVKMRPMDSEERAYWEGGAAD